MRSPTHVTAGSMSVSAAGKLDPGGAASMCDATDPVTNGSCGGGEDDDSGDDGVGGCWGTEGSACPAAAARAASPA